MPKTSKVMLGGREYVLTEKVMGVSIKWREALRQSSVMRIFESLDGALSQIVETVNAIGEGGSSGQFNLTAGINFAAVAPAVVRGLANSIDDVIALLFDYAPELQDDRAWLEENAYNEELIFAFIEVLKLNFPISALSSVLGFRAQPIATNLPSTNGGNHGTKKPMARSKSR